MNNIKIFSKNTDLLLFFTIFSLILITSYRITVYHHVYVVDVYLYRVQKDGDRINEKIGNIPKLFGFSGFKEEIFWRSVENTIDSNMVIKYNQFTYEPGTQFVWIIHYSYNSTKKDKTKKYIFEADDKGKLKVKNP